MLFYQLCLFIEWPDQAFRYVCVVTTAQRMENQQGGVGPSPSLMFFFLRSRLHFILHIQKSLKQAEFNRVNKVVSTGQQRAQNVVGKTKGS